MSLDFQENFCQTAVTDRLEEALSGERFSRYYNWAGGKRSQAFALYALNTKLSEAFYTPLQMLEITLRNRCHLIMQDSCGEWWFEVTEIHKVSKQKAMIEKAIKDTKQGGRKITPGRIVASLTFGFWTTMLGRHYENLWQQTLYKIACDGTGKTLQRKQLSEPLDKIRLLRNRIAHHEPILNRPLLKDHEDMLRITRWLCPGAALWSAHYSRFEDIYPKNGIKLRETKRKIDRPIKHQLR